MKIGIIGAMAIETELLIKELDEKRAVRRAGMLFHEGTLRGTPAVVVRSGVGKVNAGVCVQILADLFDVTHIINTGAAGSLDNRLEIGDVVISSDAIYHDVDAVCFGYQPGEIPQLGTAAFPADPALCAAAENAFADAAAAAKKECAEAAEKKPARIYTGRVVSGDQFINDPVRKSGIIRVFGGLCTEMEGAAVAQASYLNGLPFVIIRAISDKADGSYSVAYDRFELEAARFSSRLVLAMMSGLEGPESPESPRDPESPESPRDPESPESPKDPENPKDPELPE